MNTISCLLCPCHILILLHKHVHTPIEWNLYVVAKKGKKKKLNEQITCLFVTS